MSEAFMPTIINTTTIVNVVGIDRLPDNPCTTDNADTCKFTLDKNAFYVFSTGVQIYFGDIGKVITYFGAGYVKDGVCTQIRNDENHSTVTYNSSTGELTISDTNSHRTVGAVLWKIQ